jgi:hypothetical protein
MGVQVEVSDKVYNSTTLQAIQDEVHDSTNKVDAPQKYCHW